MRYSCCYKQILTAAVCLLQACFLLSQDAQVKGKVFDGTDHLPGATVLIGNKTTLTNVNGEFSFSLPAGKYNLAITHVGYSKIEETITLHPGETKNLNYVLAPLEQRGEEVLLHSLSGRKRSKFNTPVHVDVMSSESLLKTGQPSMVQMLSASVPSINISAKQQTWDPITLRGLNPDQLLLLVDGVRYHPRSSLNPPQSASGQTQIGRGSVINDLYSIPFSAIGKIELLHDGASAQHGSDAIAGVMNIQLKKLTGKTYIQFNTGQYYPGDGENINLGINHGILLNKKSLQSGRQGYVNFSADFHHRGQTYLGNTYEGQVYSNNKVEDDSTILARGFDRRRIPSGYGSLKLYTIGFLVNGGIPVKENMELFWTGILNYRYPSYGGAYRFPKDSQQINTLIYPDGFLPWAESPVRDLSIKAGIKGKTKKNWKWNFSSSYGKNKITTEVHNNNPSQQYTLGKNAPTDFKIGGSSYSQFLNNVNLVKFIKTPNGWIKSINVALGAESRLENYQIKAGEEASWKNYDPTGRKSGGQQGGIGFSDSNAINVNRHVLGVFADIETEVNECLLIDKAIRFEYYSGFGANLAGKLAARYKFSDKFLLRGSVSNSFRAPPLQQVYYSSTSNILIDQNGIRVPVVVEVFRNDHGVVSHGFGVPKLKPEKAINISGGITSYISSRFNVTVDAYWIQIKDRIVFSGRFDTLNTAVRNILQQRFIYGVQFACNAVNTRTTGVDIVINSKWNLFKGQLGFTLATNFNRTLVFGIIQAASNLPVDSVNTNTLVNRGDIGGIEKLQPSSKIILNSFYKKGKWEFTMINKRFGSTEYIHESNSLRDEFFSAKVVSDINLRFSPKSWYSITIGCNNVFNVKPDRVKNYLNTNSGRAIYGSHYLPFSPNGGYYFMSMSFSFSENKKAFQ